MAFTLPREFGRSSEGSSGLLVAAPNCKTSGASALYPALPSNPVENAGFSRCWPRAVPLANAFQASITLRLIPDRGSACSAPAKASRQALQKRTAVAAPCTRGDCPTVEARKQKEKFAGMPQLLQLFRCMRFPFPAIQQSEELDQGFDFGFVKAPLYRRIRRWRK